MSTTASPTRISYAHVRIEGTLSAVRPDDQTFTLTTPDGTAIPGWHGGCQTAADLTRFQNGAVVLVGVGRFDRGGKLLCVAASGVFPAAGRDPGPSGLTAEERREVVRRLREGLGI